MEIVNAPLKSVTQPYLVPIIFKVAPISSSPLELSVIDPFILTCALRLEKQKRIKVNKMVFLVKKLKEL